MHNLKGKLHLADHYLLDVDMDDIINLVKNGSLKREDVESVIFEYKDLDRNTHQELERCEMWEIDQHHFLESLRQAYLDGKIKTKKLDNDIIPKPKSLKSAIKRYTKKYDIDLELLRCDDTGRYSIKSFYGSSFELDLSHIVSDKLYQSLLKRNQELYLLNVLYIYAAVQAFHNVHGNKNHQMYEEISKFQKHSGFIVSDKILVGKELSQHELEDVYRVFKQVQESILHASSLSASINKKYNR